MDRKIFRKTALLNQYAPPTALDQLIQIIHPPAWILAYTLYGFLFVVLLWGIFGSIPTRVSGQGILLAHLGELHNAVVANDFSQVEKILVKVGDPVVKGEPLAYLHQPDVSRQIQVLQSYINNIQKKYERLKETSQRSIAQRERMTTMQKEALQKGLQAEEKKFQRLQKFIQLKEKALHEGLELRQNTEQTLQEYYSVQSQIEEYRQRLIQLEIQLEDFKDQWFERLRTLSLKITEDRLELSDLQKKLELTSIVLAPITGVVTQIQGSIGAMLSAGSPVMTLADHPQKSQGLDAILCINPLQGKHIKVGMKTLISPTFIEKSEFGSILGEVISISPFPANKSTALSILQNEDLVNQFFQNSAPYIVRVRLLSDNNTFSGLAWSSSKGPQYVISAGTMVRSMITTRQQSPFSLLIPAFKKTIGVDA